MLPPEHPDGIHIAFDDHRLVNNAGLMLPATLALHLGLPQLVDRHLDLGRAPGPANTGDKIVTLVASALAGGDCIVYASRGRNEPYRLGNYPGYLPWRPTQSAHRSDAASISCCWSDFSPPPSMMTDVFDDLA